VLHIIEDRCKGCAYCVDFCPRNVLSRSDRFNMKGYHPPDIASPDSCVACGFCELVCPEFAIAVEEIEVKEAAHAS
jgi:2-oxoglutarate ferredoxin oxidoreductase subunit delta